MSALSRVVFETGTPASGPKPVIHQRHAYAAWKAVETNGLVTTGSLVRVAFKAMDVCK